MAVVVLASSCTFNVDGADVDNTNLIVNGGFELGAAGTPSSWDATIILQTADHVEFSWAEGEHHKGARSASSAIQDEHQIDMGIVHYNWYQAISDGFTVGGSYDLGVWVRPKS